MADKELILKKEQGVIKPETSKLVKRGLELASRLAPRIIRVPKDYPSINLAVLHAIDGDTIEIADGGYEETIYINKSLTIVGAEKGILVFHHQDETPLITIALHGSPCTFRNIHITITNKSLCSSGILVKSGKCVIERCSLGEFHTPQEYLDLRRHDEAFWETYKGCAAIRVSGRGSRAEIRGSNLQNCEYGVSVEGGAVVEIADSCIWDSTLFVQPYSKLTSSNGYYGNAKIFAHLGGMATLESNYDTFYQINRLLLTNSSSKASFLHATISCDYLLAFIIGVSFVNPEKDHPWRGGYPDIEVRDSIVLVRDAFHNVMGEVSSTEELESISPSASIDFFSSAGQILIDKGSVKLMGNNSIHMDPYYHDPDPKCMWDDTVVRLQPDSPAVGAASDGTNIGAWQGE